MGRSSGRTPPEFGNISTGYNWSTEKLVYSIEYEWIDRYLAINFVSFGGRGVEGEEQVISAPLDEVSNMEIFSDIFVLVLVLDHAPAQHSHGE